MIRRSFFGLLSGVFLPRPLWAAASHAGEPSPSDTRKWISPPVATSDPEWLSEWMRLPRLPLIPDDFAVIPDLEERSLVALILVSIGLGEPFQFQYLGGSEPGKHRRVLPVLLFTTSRDGEFFGMGTPNRIYLLGWCQTRQAARTFRLDRMEMVEAGTQGC